MNGLYRYGVCALLAGACWTRGDTVIDDFETDPAHWGAGLQLSTERHRQGNASLDWPAARRTHIGTERIPGDWLPFRALAFWCFSEKATGNQIMVNVISENPQIDGGDYFIHTFPVDWTGWRHIEIPLERFAPARSPLGWDRVTRLDLHSRGWSQTETVPGTQLFLDEMVLLSRSPEELAELRRRKHEQRYGRIVPLGEAEDLFEMFARGNDYVLERWQTWADDPDDADSIQWRQTWHAATIRCPASASPCGVRRECDLDLAPYDTILIQSWTAPGTRLRVVLEDADGKPLASAEQQGSENLTRLAVPLDNGQLRAVRIELLPAGAGAGGTDTLQASLEWIKLRRPEQPYVDPFSHLTRAVMLRPVRPAWGADAYRLFRSRKPIPETVGTDVIVAADRIPAATPVLFDLPTEGGEWHYALAPLAEDDVGPAGPDRAVEVGALNPPIVRRTPATVVVDGDLSDWASAEGAAAISVSGPECLVSGDAPLGGSDIACRAEFAHDGDRLLVAVRVTDDVVRHQNDWAWEGDGVVVLLRFSPPDEEHPPRRYDLVVNCTADGDARLLEDRARAYPPNEKPPAPGAWAVRAADDGYTVEGAIPLSALTAFGFDPAAGGLGLGLVLFDADQPTGPTKRQTVLSWNQRRKIYAPEEAAVVPWEN
jgi:hypothetical protein